MARRRTFRRPRIAVFDIPARATKPPIFRRTGRRVKNVATGFRTGRAAAPNLRPCCSDAPPHTCLDDGVDEPRLHPRAARLPGAAEDGAAPGERRAWCAMRTYGTPGGGTDMVACCGGVLASQGCLCGGAVLTLPPRIITHPYDYCTIGRVPERPPGQLERAEVPDLADSEPWP